MTAEMDVATHIVAAIEDFVQVYLRRKGTDFFSLQADLEKARLDHKILISHALAKMNDEVIDESHTD